MTFERGGTVRSVEIRPSDAGWSATVREGDRVMANMTYMGQAEGDVVASLTRSLEASGFKQVGGRPGAAPGAPGAPPPAKV